MSLPAADQYLASFETTLKEFDLDLQSKSNSRVLTSSVWMQDKLSAKLNGQLFPLLHALEELSKQSKNDSGLENNLAMSAKYANELIKTMQDLLMTYRQAAGITDMKIKWAHSLQKMKEDTNHLRNRINIIQGMKAREKDPRNWLPF